MHPDITSTEPGKCGKCQMTLVAGSPFDTRDYGLQFGTVPSAIRPGIPFEMRFIVRHPETGVAINAFETVHDKRYHLFIVSHDLEFFQHVHPEMLPDGTWTIQTAVPKAGYYRALSDFLPTGGSPQFLGRTFVTAGFDGDFVSQEPKLVPDPALKRAADTITAEVRLETIVDEVGPPRPYLVEGRWGHLNFTLTDTRSGTPVTDLQPYLGAFGHTLILSEDLRDYVHSHPSAESPEGTASSGLGGPYVNFEGYMPRQGRYRMWTQFLRSGRVETVSFTFTVGPPEDAVAARR